MSSSTTNETNHLIADNNQTVVALNTQNFIKLTASNYPAWKVLMNALFVGHDLIGYVDGTKHCPAEGHKDLSHWKRQDQFIIHAIISSVDQSVVTLLGNVKSSKQAWDILKKTFASKTRSRIIHLKEKLSRSNKGSKFVSEYLHGIKAIADELAIINSPLDDDDLVIHTMNVLGAEYKEVSASVRTREKSVSFEELHDLLADFESYLHRDEITQESPPIIAANAAQRGKVNYPKKG